MITKFGKFLRNLRMDRDEILKNMAEKLNVSSAFLSSVENGKKRIPDGWVDKIAQLYGLSGEECDNLREAAYETNNNIDIGLTDLSNERRKLALSFARKLNGFSEEEIKEFLKFLGEDS